MAKVTRRGLIKRTSVGAATAGALMAAPGLLSGRATAAVGPADLSTEALREPLVAYVRNVEKGELGLLVGTREVIIRDRELVMRLVKAAQ